MKPAWDNGSLSQADGVHAEDVAGNRGLGAFLATHTKLAQCGLGTHGLLINDVLDAGVVVVGQFIHQGKHDLFHDTAQGASAGFAGRGPLRDDAHGTGGVGEFGTFDVEEMRVLLDKRILGLGQDVDHRLDAEGRERGEHGQAADKLGDHAKLDKVVGGDLLVEDRRLVVFVGWRAGKCVRRGGGLEANLCLAQAATDDLFEANKGARADEEDVGGVDLDVLLLGVLAAALGRDIADGAFEHLEEALLHAFARDIAGDADVVGGLADLVDLVDVDDAALCSFEIKVRALEEFQYQILDIFADVARLGQGGGIANGEGHLEHAGQALGEQGLAAARGPDHQDVALIDLDVASAL